MGIGEQREEGKFFKKRRDFHCFQETAKICVCTCVFSEHFSHIFKTLFPTSDFFIHFMPSLLIANVNRWDFPNVREHDSRVILREKRRTSLQMEDKSTPKLSSEAKAECFTIIIFSNDRN